MEITALLIEPNKEPREIIMANELEDFQKAVGGYIETISPFDDKVVLVLNEEGKLKNLETNRILIDQNGRVLDALVGNMLLCYFDPMESEDFQTLPEDLIQKYKEILSTFIVTIPSAKQTEAASIGDKTETKPTATVHYAILQLKDIPSLAKERFSSIKELENMGLQPDIDNYDVIYTGHIEPYENRIDMLEELYMRFNVDHPEDFSGHSLSVSDVVLIKENEDINAYYVDTIGFYPLPTEFVEQEPEQKRGRSR